MLVRATVLIFALTAALAAGWVVLKMQAPQADVQAVDAEPPTKLVLVAAEPIAGGAVLTPGLVKWEAWPENALNGSFIQREDQPGAVQELSGSFVNRALAEGEPISPDQLMETNINLLSNKITPGMRATAVRVSAESTAGGFILPGDRVDVIHTVTMTDESGGPSLRASQIIAANVRVLAIDQTAVQSPEGSAIGETATLELTPDEAERIVGAEASGLLTLVLRAVADHGTDDREIEFGEGRVIIIHRGPETSVVSLD